MSMIRGAISSILVPLVIGTTSHSLHAQEIEKDYAKYARPFLFVLPESPSSSASSPSPAKFVAQLKINVDGSVQTPVEVIPNDPAMTAAVSAVARFWTFYPELATDCRPVQRAGRIGFEYDTKGGRAWVEMPSLAGIDNFARTAVKSFSSDSPPEYPDEELARGIEGRVVIAMKLMPNGSTADHVVYFAAPRAKGLMQTALKHSRSFKVSFVAPIDRPYLCTLVPYMFRM